MLELRQSTAGQEIPLGYFLDSTDGNTEETGLTIANTDIKLWKFGATTLANKNSGGATHISNGLYYSVLDATDTDTLGSMVVFIHVAGALAVKVECCVLTANVWDSKYSTDKLEVDLKQIGGVEQSQTDLKDLVDTGYDPATHKVQGVVLTDTTTTNTDMAGTDNAALASVCTEARLAELDAANLPADVDTLITRIPAEVAQKSHLVNGTGDITPPANIGIWDSLGDGGTSISGLNNFDYSSEQVTVTTNNDKTGYALSAAGVDDFHDEIMEGTTTFREAIRLFLSVLTGKSSGGGTSTAVFRDIGDTKTRVSATVDANGNRTAVGTRDGS